MRKREVLSDQSLLARAEYENRPPFDPAETIQMFEESYRTRMKYGSSRFPGWVLEKVDKQLLALNLLPESVYSLLKMEERANQKALRAINKRQKENGASSESKSPERFMWSFRSTIAAYCP